MGPVKNSTGMVARGEKISPVPRVTNPETGSEWGVKNCWDYGNPLREKNETTGEGKNRHWNTGRPS